MWGVGSGCSGSSLLPLPCCCLLPVLHHGTATGLSPFRSVPLPSENTFYSSDLGVAHITSLPCSSLPGIFCPSLNRRCHQLHSGPHPCMGEGLLQRRLKWAVSPRDSTSCRRGHPCSLSPRVFQLECVRCEKGRGLFWGGLGGLGIAGEHSALLKLTCWPADALG